MPLIVPAFAHVELHEGAGLGHFLPGRGRLAGAQPHDGIVDAEGLARLHAERAGDAVALVEQADFRHALRHRRARQAGSAAHGIAGDLFGRAGIGIGFGRLARATSRQRGDEGGQGETAARRRDAPGPDHASGAQAS